LIVLLPIVIFVKIVLEILTTTVSSKLTDVLIEFLILEILLEGCLFYRYIFLATSCALDCILLIFLERALPNIVL